MRFHVCWLARPPEASEASKGEKRVVEDEAPKDLESSFLINKDRQPQRRPTHSTQILSSVATRRPSPLLL